MRGVIEPMSFSKELHITRSGRGYVKAYIASKNLCVYKDVRDDMPDPKVDPKGYSQALTALEKDAKAWESKMDALEKAAIEELKKLYREHK